MNNERERTTRTPQLSRVERSSEGLPPVREIHAMTVYHQSPAASNPVSDLPHQALLDFAQPPSHRCGGAICCLYLPDLESLRKICGVCGTSEVLLESLILWCFGFAVCLYPPRCKRRASTTTVTTATHPGVYTVIALSTMMPSKRKASRC